MPTYTVRLSTRAGGILHTATVHAPAEITLAELVRRADLHNAPANGGDTITIEEDPE